MIYEGLTGTDGQPVLQSEPAVMVGDRITGDVFDLALKIRKLEAD